MRTAASEGDIATVKRLLEAGVDPDAANDYGATALFRVADKGHAAVARLLLEKGADPNLQDSFYGATAFGWALSSGHADVALVILENGYRDLDGALAGAVRGGASPLVDAILAKEGLSRSGVLGALDRVRGASEPDAALVAKLEKVAASLAPAHELSPERAKGYEGYYSSDDGSALTIELQDGELVATFDNERRTSTVLDPRDPVSFRARRFSRELTFLFEGETVTGFEWPSRGGPQLYSRGPAPAATADEQADSSAADRGTTGAASTAPSTGAEASIPAGVATRHWPQFRGPNAAGTAQGNPPAEWDLETGRHVLWQREIPGLAHASPAVWGDRLYLTTAVADKDEGEFRSGLYGDVDSVKIESDYSWRVYALDVRSGKVVWDRVAHEGRPRSAHHLKATQANPSPATDGRHVVAMLGSEGLYCWSSSGELLWKKDLGVIHSGWFYDASYQWGHSSSPILHDGKVIVQVDRHEDAFIAAFDLATGEEVWRTGRDNLPSWSTPTIFRGEKGPQVVANGTKRIRGYDAATGKELWSLGPNSEVVVGTPVVGHGMVYVTGGYPPVRPIYAVRPGARGELDVEDGDAPGEHLAWANMSEGTYMPTPLLYGDLLYTLANNGVLRVFDARTGERLYRHRVAGRGGVAFTASPVAA
ncbi:MAG: PQQ-binding-like beta-propeller repeat protein, partial [Holophagales bacterium]|nr:PQQ-binding-like beta-propeller repeat protein [Holophagales bacterium]